MNKRIGNLEFRCNKEGRPAEIVCWQPDQNGKEFCYTLLWYKRNSEGYYIEFVGQRPLDHGFDGGLWALMQYGQEVLNAEFKLEEQLR